MKKKTSIIEDKQLRGKQGNEIVAKMLLNGSKRRKYTREENMVLLYLVTSLNTEISWDIIANSYNSVPGIFHCTSEELRNRYDRSLDPNLKKGRWSEDENLNLIKIL